jgi:hypothetical protein
LRDLVSYGYTFFAPVFLNSLEALAKKLKAQALSSKNLKRFLTNKNCRKICPHSAFSNVHTVGIYIGAQATLLGLTIME